MYWSSIIHRYVGFVFLLCNLFMATFLLVLSFILQGVCVHMKKEAFFCLVLDGVIFLCLILITLVPSLTKAKKWYSMLSQLCVMLSPHVHVYITIVAFIACMRNGYQRKYSNISSIRLMRARVKENHTWPLTHENANINVSDLAVYISLDLVYCEVICETLIS